MATNKTITQAEDDVNVTFRLPKDIDRAVEKAAYSEDITKQQIFERAVRELLANEGYL